MEKLVLENAPDHTKVLVSFSAVLEKSLTVLAVGTGPNATVVAWAIVIEMNDRTVTIRDNLFIATSQVYGMWDSASRREGFDLRSWSGKAVTS